MASGTETVGIADARREIAGGEAVAVDVRSEEEWRQGHVPGAIHLPEADLDGAAHPPDTRARLIVIAKDGRDAAEAADRLSGEGYVAVAVDGDMGDWVSQGFNIQPTRDPDEDTELGLK